MTERDAPLTGPWRPLYLAVLLIAFALLLYAALPILSPFVLFLVLLILGGPYLRERPVLLLLGAALFVLVLWMLKATGGVLAPFVLALVLAYVLDPAVDWLERRRVPRGIGIILLSLPVIGLVLLAILVGLPALGAQLLELVEEAPAALERLRDWAETSGGRLFGIDLPFVDEAALLQPILELDSERLTRLARERQGEIAQRAWDAVLGVGRGVGALLSILGYVVLTPVLTFYLLRDYDRLTATTGDLFPRRHQTSWQRFLSEFDDLLSRYLRGQLLAAATVGTLTWLGLWALGFPYSGLVGAVAGVFNLVPYLGLIVSLVPAVIIALLSDDVLWSFGRIAIVFAIVQALDGTVIGPRIVGGSVGLHPVWVILALAVGGFFFGFVGLLIAVPGAILIKLLVLRAIERYRRSSLYGGGPVSGGAPPA